MLYLFETSPDTTNKDEVVSIVKKFFDIRDLISDTKEQILDLVDIINATEKLRLLEKEVQEKYNIELFTEENIQRLVYQNQLYMSDNLTMTFS